MDAPWRPIPSGLVSLEGCRLRVVGVATALLALGSMTRATAHALTQWWLIFAYHVLGGDRHLAGKSVLAAAGLVDLVRMAAGRQLARRATFRDYLTELFVTVTLLLALGQDTRDVEGDAKLGRRTVPVVIGRSATRILNAAFLLCLPLAHARWARRYRSANATTAAAVATDAAMAAVAWTCAARTLLARGREADCRTWRLTSMWLPAFCASVVTVR